MRQDQLDGLVTFVAVAETRGFSAAAVRLGVSPSAVSQAVRLLEKRVGVPLFNRTTRSVNLTEAGARFLERIGPAVQELALASEELSDSAERPSGLLRLTVSRGAYLWVLQPVLGAFLRAYPQIDLEVSIDNTLVDIVGQGFDAGIRFGGMVERDMVGMRVGPPMANCIVAAPRYLAERGTPVHPRELLAHDCIGFRFASSGQLERWEFEKNGEAMTLAVSGRLVMNDVALMLDAAVDGIGIANLIGSFTERHIVEGRLVQLLADWTTPLPDLALYYPDRKRVPPKLRVLIDWLRSTTSCL
ncbi:LysR family transcriptional regulator [Variovorax sp. J22P271]|uniref:LysR family transcriptional regulator n=1 Tax=Variovorax davisae TaxID=3053515 RepID=UPI0025759F7D|nr:LysR family transcriptional regulator [Variovorax sp. J22P271]MDM0032026.1 LysR family transcriptional regulator [Variovorax sp. J22P271]